MQKRKPYIYFHLPTTYGITTLKSSVNVVAKGRVEEAWPAR